MICKEIDTKHITKINRSRVRAYCVIFSTHKRILLSLKLKKVISRLSGEGDNIEWLECSGRHPPIEMIHTIPTKLSLASYKVGHLRASSVTVLAIICFLVEHILQSLN